jgi:hypothetical protein
MGLFIISVASLIPRAYFWTLFLLSLFEIPPFTVPSPFEQWLREPIATPSKENIFLYDAFKPE